MTHAHVDRQIEFAEVVILSSEGELSMFCNLKAWEDKPITLTHFREAILVPKHDLCVHHSQTSFCRPDSLTEAILRHTSMFCWARVSL